MTRQLGRRLVDALFPATLLVMGRIIEPAFIFESREQPFTSARSALSGRRADASRFHRDGLGDSLIF